MKVELKTGGGGLFSLYHLAIELLLEGIIQNPGLLDSIKEYKITIDDNHYIQNKNLFDDFFSYNYDNINLKLLSQGWKRIFLKIHESPYYNTIKQIIKLNKIRPEIISQVEAYAKEFKFNRNTLSVHVRLTDMNKIHGSDYGVFTFNDYKNKIDYVLNENGNIENIFICSDNNESIKKIIQLYGEKYKVSFIKDTYRVENEQDDNYNFSIENTNKFQNFHIKIFIELLTASKSKYLIYRISDFSNFILAYSDTIEYIYSIN